MNETYNSIGVVIQAEKIRLNGKTRKRFDWDATTSFL